MKYKFGDKVMSRVDVHSSWRKSIYLYHDNIYGHHVIRVNGTQANGTDVEVRRGWDE